MGTAPDFNVDDVRLPQLAVRVWQGLVFAAVDEAHAPDFDAFVAGIDARLGADRGLEHYGHHQRVGYDVACNWKVYVDNYLEGYHVPHVHPGLNKLLDYRSYVTETAEWYSLQFSPLESDDGAVRRRRRAVLLAVAEHHAQHPARPAADQPRGPARAWIAAGSNSISITRWTNRMKAQARRAADLSFSDEVQVEDLDHLRGRAARAGVGLVRTRTPEPAARERGAPLPRTAARVYRDASPVGATSAAIAAPPAIDRD